MFKDMKTGHYHSQNSYEVSVGRLLSKIQYPCMKVDRDGDASFSLRKWAGSAHALLRPALPECLPVSGDQVLTGL